MLFAKVVRPEGLPEEIEMPVYPLEGDDVEALSERLVNFYKSNPVAFMGSRKVELFRVVEMESITTLEMPEPDMQKMASGIMDMIGRNINKR